MGSNKCWTAANVPNLVTSDARLPAIYVLIYFVCESSFWGLGRGQRSGNCGTGGAPQRESWPQAGMRALGKRQCVLGVVDPPVKWYSYIKMIMPGRRAAPRTRCPSFDGCPTFFRASRGGLVLLPPALRANVRATLATRTLASCDKNQCMKKSGRKCRGAGTRRRKGRGCGGANAQKIPRRTGYAKRHAGSVFDFILSCGTCTRTWSVWKRSRRWRSGGRQNGELFTESPRMATTQQAKGYAAQARLFVVRACGHVKEGIS